MQTLTYIGDRPVARRKPPVPPPFAIGHECIAEVVDVGDGVTHVQPGDHSKPVFVRDPVARPDA